MIIEASDDTGVSGYYLSEDDDTAPTLSSTWLDSEPTSYTLSGTGEHRLYLWVRDEAGNISTVAGTSVTYSSSDTTSPVISAFTCPVTTGVATVSLTIEASDNTGVTGYYLSEDDNTAPTLSSTWLDGEPTSYTLSGEGSHTLYLWVKDAAGNISDVASTSVNYDATAPVISEFTCPETTTEATIALAITASDAQGVTAYLVKEENITPGIDDSNWTESQPSNYTLSAEGIHTLYLWVKDAAGNISDVSSSSVIYDATAPVISAFSCPATTDVATVSLSITVSDNTGITGYYLSEDNNTAPTLLSTWLDSEPTSYTLSAEGSHTLYLWVKDEAGNISEVASASVTYTGSEAPAHFTTVWSGNGYNHMNFMIVLAQVDETDLSAGDEIGIFDGNLCVGAAVLTGAVSSDDMLTMVASSDDGTGNGYTEEDTILYRVYLKSTDEEIDICSAIYTENENLDSDGKFKVGGSAAVSLSCDNLKEQTINVMENWNIISVFVQPSSPSMSSVFEEAVNNESLYKVLDQGGNSYEDWGVYGGWKNNIGDFTVGQGYQLKASSDFTFSVLGTSIPLPLEIPLTGGWNIISYPSAQGSDATEVFSSLMEQNVLRKVMDEEGNSMQDWGESLGGWTNNIGNLVPGKGYRVYVYSDCSLTINSGVEKSLRIVPRVARGTHFTPVYKGNGYFHMDMNIPDLSATGLEKGDEVAFFDGDRCVGSAKVSSSDIDFNRLSVACSSDDDCDGIPNGFLPGNPVTVKVFYNGEESNLSVEYLKGVPVYEQGGTAVITFNVKQAEETGLSGSFSFDAHVYPNPFDNQLTIEVDMGDDKSLSIDIIDITGKVVRRIYQGEAETDHVVLKWNGENESGRLVSPGIYFCKINEKVIRIVRQ